MNYIHTAFIKKQTEKVYHRYLYKIAGASLFLASSGITSFAQSVGLSGDTVGDVEWPWIKMLNSLAKQFSGPVPIALGIMALIGAAFSMLQGGHGQVSGKMIGILFAVAIALFSPTLISYVQTSAGGLTIYGL